MSLIHICLHQICNDNEIAFYRVESPDFSEKRNWEELGVLQILKRKKEYEFIGSQLAKDNKLIPPKLYNLTEEERQRILNNEYPNYGFGAWSMCINHWAKTLIINNSYPKKYPI